MPIPKVKPSEDKNKYISRCVSQLIAEGKEQDEALAICYVNFKDFSNTEIDSDLEIKEFSLENIFGEEGKLNLISLVSDPAVEVEAHLFNKIKPQYFSTIDEEKQIITGIAMVPDKKILRLNDTTKEYYYCYFSKSTIEKAAQLFSKNSGFLQTSFEHNGKLIDKIYVFESWIIGKEDKIYSLGFNKQQAPEGSWAVSFKVEDKVLWEKVKKMYNEVGLGFSIEGDFISNFSNLNNILNNVEEKDLPNQLEKKEKVKRSGKYQILYSTISEILINKDFSYEEKYDFIKQILKNL